MRCNISTTALTVRLLNKHLPFDTADMTADPSKAWPPPDPDRMLRASRRPPDGEPFTQPMDMESFKARQAADLARYEDADGEYVIRRRPFHERLEAEVKREKGKVYELEDEDDDEGVVTDEEESDEGSGEGQRGDGDGAGEEGWRNKEGERLADFGVDEVADFYDEEDEMPLADLIRRRKGE